MFSEFKNAVDSRDLARQNQYEVNVEGLSRQENMLCIDVDLPSPNIITMEYKHQGPAKKIPYDVVYGDLTMTFMCFGDDGQPYGKFNDWLEEIFDDTYRFNDKSDYVRTVMVKEKSRQGSTYKTHTFYEAFPTIVGPKSKSSSSTNTPDQFIVQFSYLYSSQS